MSALVLVLRPGVACSEFLACTAPKNLLFCSTSSFVPSLIRPFVYSFTGSCFLAGWLMFMRGGGWWGGGGGEGVGKRWGGGAVAGFCCIQKYGEQARECR